MPHFCGIPLYKIRAVILCISQGSHLYISQIWLIDPIEGGVYSSWMGLKPNMNTREHPFFWFLCRVEFVACIPSLHHDLSFLKQTSFAMWCVIFFWGEAYWPFFLRKKSLVSFQNSALTNFVDELNPRLPIRVLSIQRSLDALESGLHFCSPCCGWQGIVPDAKTARTKSIKTA